MLLWTLQFLVILFRGSETNFQKDGAFKLLIKVRRNYSQLEKQACSTVKIKRQHFKTPCLYVTWHNVYLMQSIWHS